MAAPTLVATYVPASNWNVGGTVTKTTSVTVGVGDSLVLVAACEAAAATFTATGGTGITWGSATLVNAASRSSAAMWTVASVGSAQTFTLQVDKAGGGGSTDVWGFMLLRWSGGGVVGTPVSGSGAASTPSVAITTAAANSAISCINTDWNATSGARTYRQVNAANPTERDYFGVAGSTYIGEVFTYADSGAAGAKTVGLTAPTGENWASIAVEVQGGATGGANVTAVAATATAAMGIPAVSGSGGASVTAVAMTATAAFQIPAVSGETVVSGGGPATATATMLAPTVSGGTAGSGNVTTVTATATATALAPVVQGGATVTAVAATATAQAVAPTVSVISGVLAVAANATAAMLAPTVTAASGATVQAAPAGAAAAMLTPSIFPTPGGVHYRFSPPTHEEPIRTEEPWVRHFRLTWANSVVWRSGQFVSTKGVTSEELAALEQGVTYFRGGTDYVVDQATSDALNAAGYITTPIQE